MRERLIDLIDDALSAWESYRSMCFKIGEDPNVGFEEFVADYLLQDGVIVPPCNIEQSIYRGGLGKADVVEVVRCKECIHYTPCEGGLSLCCYHRRAVGEQDFCSDGERKEKKE